MYYEKKEKKNGKTLILKVKLGSLCFYWVLEKCVVQKNFNRISWLNVQVNVWYPAVMIIFPQIPKDIY